MSEIVQRSIFIHIDLPGQENDATLFEGPYPSIQELGENLIPRVLDDLKVPICVGIGEGAGKCEKYRCCDLTGGPRNLVNVLLIN